MDAARVRQAGLRVLSTTRLRVSEAGEGQAITGGNEDKRDARNDIIAGIECQHMMRV